MLPPYIIDEILRRERKKKAVEEVLVERTELDYPNQREYPSRPADETPQGEERGVAIIDFTI